VPLNWTTAQKSDPRNFSTGQVLGFNRAVKGIAKNETLEVVRIADKSVVVRNAVGEERALTGKQAKSFDVYERRSIEVATGDRLLLTANRRENGFRVTNGEIVMVTEVDRLGRICLEDGRTLPAGFRHFAHGYAVTAHRSQGKSVDAVIISGDGMRKELFYVAASRGRQKRSGRHERQRFTPGIRGSIVDAEIGLRAGAQSGNGFRARCVPRNQGGAAPGDAVECA
jgi:ATP-dependent exoDNAse (exonuclease V) alpha subunit